MHTWGASGCLLRTTDSGGKCRQEVAQGSRLEASCRAGWESEKCLDSEGLLHGGLAESLSPAGSQRAPL